MKKVTKLLLVVCAVFMLVGCGVMKKSAKGAVEDFLNQYKNLSSNVIAQSNEVVEEENLTEEQKEVYRDILQKQYKDLKYEITNEEYNGDTALVEAKITVYDLYKVQKSANEYLAAHSGEFNDDTGTFSNEIFMDYKLDTMQKAKDIVEYTIMFKVSKDEDGNYKVLDLTHEDLQKIHGIYNYDQEK